VPRASSSRHKPEYSRHSPLGTAGPAKASLLRATSDALGTRAVRPLGSRQRKFFQIKKLPTAPGAHRPAPPPPPIGRHHHPSCAARTTQLRRPHHLAPPPPCAHHHHHCRAHTVDATTSVRTHTTTSAAAARTPPPPPQHKIERGGARKSSLTGKREKVAVAPGRSHQIWPRLPGRSCRGGGEPPDPPRKVDCRGRRPQIGRHRASSSSQGGCSCRTRRRGGRLRLPDKETRRAATAESAATAPRPAAAPRHEVRGERRGKEGAARLSRRRGDEGGSAA
jgi:hypothetical protein